MKKSGIFNSNQIDSLVHRQAADWFARLRSAEHTERDVRAFHAWLELDAKHRQAFDEIDQLWHKSRDLKDHPKLAVGRAYLEQIKAKASIPPNADRNLLENKSKRAGAFMRRFAIAAALILAVGAGIVFSLFLKTETERYYTAVGEQKIIRLEDGTRIILNTKTTLDVAYTAAQRKVIFVRGQAGFAVSHDPSRPFIVEVDNNKITVLGTEFDVYRRQYSDQAGDEADTIVTLLRGSVEVTPNSRAVDNNIADQPTVPETFVTLKPGEQITLSNEGKIQALEKVDLSNINAWRDGKLKFDDTLLLEAVAEANRYGGKQLILTDPALGQLKISGVFETGQNENIAKALRAFFGVEIKIRRDKNLEILPPASMPDK